MILDESASSTYSQNGEDGIIARIFDVIGFESRLFVEFGFGVAENNSWRLVEDEAFGGLYVDIDYSQCEAMNVKLLQQERTNVRVLREHLSVWNIENVLCPWMPAEIDLLSIDVDGNDYWLWKAIERISPRLVVIEYNRYLGPDVSVTIPYDPGFEWQHDSHFGASLRALAKLGEEKGYKLIGCDPNGINAFFLRGDIDGFDAADPADAFRGESCRHQLKGMEWEEV